MTVTTAPVSCGSSIGARIEAGLRERLGDERFGKCFEGSVRFRVSEDRVEAIVPTPFLADLLDRQFGAVLREVVRDVVERSDVTIAWSVHTPQDVALKPAPSSKPATPSVSPRPTVVRHPARSHAAPADLLRYRLEDFVVSSSNRLAHAAAMRIADEPQEAGALGLLFIHGMCGVGKTHLLHGVARRFLERRPGARIRCTTGERFANEFIASVQSGGRGIEAFRARHRGLDLLCIDDAHFIAGKTATQQEFLHTFDALDLGGARVVIVSDNHPREIAKFDHHLVSRCISGMVVKVEAPDRELRARLAQSVAARRGLMLGEGSADAIAQLCHGSAREIEGAVARLRALLELAPELTPSGVITPTLVARALEADAPQSSTRRPIRVNDVVDVVCRELSAPASEVLGDGRHKRVVLARSLAAALARDLTTCSFPEIARALGRDTHSTIIAACRRIKEQIQAGASCGVSGGAGLDGVRLADLYDRLRGLILRAG